MRAIQTLSCIAAIVALFSCTKTVVDEEKDPELIRVPDRVMTTPGPSEINSGYIYLDPADGHYKSALFDFGSQLTRISSGYVTGQAGVGISSITARDAGLISAEIEGDKFVAYLPSFLSLPFNDGPLYTVKPAVIGYEVDTVNLPPCCTQITHNIFFRAQEKVYILDSIKAKAKGIKLKTPVSTTVIDGPLFSANSNGILIFKGRILMNTNSPTGMAIYPYDQAAIDDSYSDLGSYYVYGNINNYVFFRANSLDVNRGYGPITEVLSYLPFSETPVGSFRVEFGSSPETHKYYVTCVGKLQDGSDFILNDELLSFGIM